MFRLVRAKTRENTQGWNTKQAKRLENTAFSEGLTDKSEFVELEKSEYGGRDYNENFDIKWLSKNKW